METLAATLLVAARVLWVLTPAYVANATATLPRGRGPPMDFGHLYARDGRRLLGPSKTWSGFLCGTAFAVVVGLVLEYLILIAPPDLQLVPRFGPSLLASVPVLVLLGAGALTGDAIGSFIKRRRAIAPGGRMFLLDQLLFVLVPVGLGLALVPATFDPAFWSLEAVAWTAFFTIVLHIVFNYIGFWLGLKKVPW